MEAFTIIFLVASLVWVGFAVAVGRLGEARFIRAPVVRPRDLHVPRRRPDPVADRDATGWRPLEVLILIARARHP